jgi:superfamily II RNA helicase
MVKICNTPFPTDSDEKYKEHFDKFPHPLSDFQKHAIDAIVTGNHALITAHTGSGKTLPAEFAIEYFVSRGKKVIYTSPIKALSNQKYFEFSQKYPNISFGLYTGDIKTNPTADCIIMTAEILMNSLFTNSNDVQIEEGKSTEENRRLDFQLNLNTDLACVIMDEIHYINDAERGEVWEKTIMLLPPHIQLVMLSATIDAPEKFANWIEDVKRPTEDVKRPTEKNVYLASTTIRSVPLTHYSYFTVPELLFKKIKDKSIQEYVKKHTNKPFILQSETGTFKPDELIEINKLKNMLELNAVPCKRQFVLNNLALHLKNNDMLPAIVFVFSRKNVELYAREVTIPLLEDDSKVPYTVARECEQIIRKLPNYEEFLHLPEYVNLVKLLEKGIGIHHSGMIPILREIVELMISKKIIKMLFCTESFAVGLSCPIRTVVFTSLTKFDGVNERFLYSHEYTQMSGRAGRRGIDTIGNVIHCNNLFESPTQNEYKNILSGKPQLFHSKFHITMQLVLNLIKNGMNCNFHEFIEKSMIMDEIVFRKTSIQSSLSNFRQSREILENEMQYMKTPLVDCLKYNNLLELLPSSVNKKKKDIQKQIDALKDINFTIEKDASLLTKIGILDGEISYDTAELEKMEGYLVEKVEYICKILLKHKFIAINVNYKTLEEIRIMNNLRIIHSLSNTSSLDAEYSTSYGVTPQITPKIINPSAFSKNIQTIQEHLTTCYSYDTIELENEMPPRRGSLNSINLDNKDNNGEERISTNSNNNITLTELGIFASYIAEINSIPFSLFMIETEYLKGLTQIHIVGFLSCFTDIKVKQELVLFFPHSKNDLLNVLIKKYDDKNSLFQIENSNPELGMIQNVNGLVYDIVDIVMEWCVCKDEEDCKIFVHSYLSEKEISIGDFAKAILKISTIAKEIMNACEKIHKTTDIMDFIAKLSGIDAMILKYIATTQSLYV